MLLLIHRYSQHLENIKPHLETYKVTLGGKYSPSLLGKHNQVEPSTRPDGVCDLKSCSLVKAILASLIVRPKTLLYLNLSQAPRLQSLFNQESPPK